MPGLDVVRGMAITGVVFYHGLASVSQQASLPDSQSGLLSWFQYGAMGVHLFFVLSGFLITGILLDTRDDADYYKNFYLRRVLRIVPAYLLMIILLKATGNISWIYLATCLLYLCNMTRMLGARPEYGPLWSLSVEEQFYLTWPLLVRQFSTRALLYVSAAIVVLTPVLRYGLQFTSSGWGDIHYKTWDVADFFAAGAILAISVRSRRMRLQLPSAWKALVTAGILLLPASIWWQHQIGERWIKWMKLANALALCPYLVLFSGVLLFGFLHPQISKGRLGRGFVFLGDISYGLYLCHQYLFNQVERFLPLRPALGISAFGQIWLRFCVELAISVLVAALSRRYFEAIFLKLKPRPHTAVAS